MAREWLLLSLLCIFFSPLISTPAVVPDPAPVNPQPSTIPAFPEQYVASAGENAVAGGGSCPLDLTSDIVGQISSSCFLGSGGLVDRSQCCPVLGASLLAAYSGTALSLPSRDDLPVLPDDSESCAAAAERALRLPRANATCGAVYCYCGVRLRRLACPLFVASKADARWVPSPAAARRLERDCGGGGGTARCLAALGQGVGPGGAREDCELMGLAWLLSRDRKRYLPAAAGVLRALAAADDVPLAVGAEALDSNGIPPCCVFDFVFTFLCVVNLMWLF